ncbi:MAG: hypothetical protein PHU56_01455 [Candidatus Pacebacteria bacterium]|nr:hypothetical protein [Candidatus Paceibacterota bacterium]
MEKEPNLAASIEEKKLLTPEQIYESVRSNLEDDYEYSVSMADKALIDMIIASVLNEMKDMKLKASQAVDKEKKKHIVRQYENSAPALYESEVIDQFLFKRFGMNRPYVGSNKKEFGAYLNRLREKEEML